MGCRLVDVCGHDLLFVEHGSVVAPRPASATATAGRCRKIGYVQILLLRCGQARNAMKKLVVFDLDGTLAESKSSLDAEMAALLGALMGIGKVAVISGGGWSQFEKQVLSHLPHDESLKN